MGDPAVAERPPASVRPKPDRRRHPRVPVQQSPYDEAFRRRRDEEASRTHHAKEADAASDEEPHASSVFQHALG